MKRLLIRTAMMKGLYLLPAILIAVSLFGVSPALGVTLKWKTSIYGWVDQDNLAVGADGTVYVPVETANVSEKYQLYAMNPTGTHKWTFNILREVRGTPAIGPDGTIYMGSRTNALYAISDQGQEVWSFSTEGRQTKSSPAIGSDGTIYIGSILREGDGTIGYTYSSYLHAVRPDGTEKWAYQFVNGPGVDHTPVIGPDGTIYVVAEDPDQHLYAFYPDGDVKWISPTSMDGRDTYSPSIGADGTIYVSSNGGLFAFNPADGDLKWVQNIDSYFASAVIGSNNTIYIGSTDHKLYALNPVDGSVNWSYTATDGINAGPVISADGYIIFASTDGVVSSISPSGLLMKWTYDTTENMFASPVISDDGTVYMATYVLGNNYLIALEDNSGPSTTAPWPKVGGNNRNTGNYSGDFPKALSPINNVTIPEIPNGTLGFNWNASDFDPDYQFQISGNPAFNSAMAASTASPFIGVNGSLFNAGYQYFWRVGVTNTNGYLSYGDTQSFIYGSLSHVVISSPAYGAIVENPVHLAWNFPGAAKYALQIAADQGFSQLVFSNYVTITEGYLNLNDDTTYYMRVFAADINGNALTPWSHVYQFKTRP